MFKISVIIPTYNRAKYLQTTIESVLQQTIPVFEILICDDGSTDNSKEIVLNFTDKRVKWIEGIHVGLPSAPRNRGIMISKGDWIAFLDSDDYWVSNKLEEQFKKINECCTDAVCSNAFRVLPGNQEDRLYHNFNENIFKFKDLLFSNKIICSSVVIKKDILKKTGMFNEHEKFKAIEDYALWLKVSTYTNWAYVNDGLVKYLDDPINSIRSVGITVLEQKRIILKDYLKWNKNPLSKNFLRAFFLYSKIQLIK